MGIIDSKIFVLKCQKCGIKESAKVLDKGSSWGGSSWEGRPDYSKFETQWTGGGKEEPELLSAKCKTCGQQAKVESCYGGL